MTIFTVSSSPLVGLLKIWSGIACCRLWLLSKGGRMERLASGMLSFWAIEGRVTERLASVILSFELFRVDVKSR